MNNESKSNPQASFVVVANRLPVEQVTNDDGSTTWRTSPGGLVTAMEPVMKNQDGAWIGWSGAPGEKLDPFEADDIKQVPVELSQDEINEYYEGFSNATLWPLYHDSVAFPEYHREWWDAYVKVNQRFADAAAEVAEEGATVWVQDYQLQLVPKMLRDVRPDLKIGFFLHIPFPPGELFGQLPWRERILEGLAGADLVGFQTPEGAANFLRLLRTRMNYQVQRDTFTTPDGRRSRARAYPISIDVQMFEDLARSPEVKARAKEIRDDLDAKTVFFGVDRLDYTKGLRQRIRAFGELFKSGELDADEAVFLQVATPSRERVEEYKRLRDDIELLVGRINGDMGRIGRSPITYLHNTFPRSEMAAMYLAADVMVVTPLRDGMNLVAKEYLACRPNNDGALVLSEFAGAALELKQAYMVNPYDINGMKNTTLQAMNDTAANKRRRMRALRRQVVTHDIKKWASDFLGDLDPDMKPDEG
ncbi:alpha,alpha-trehalose-phosphate synthase (UDP-forming) [Nigerium massiliense]|uniref:alpha,alpha-trehalose-phosphate synthase (UDP-forming) n=1 Tax=Nigerium massiliense TaxID=1522317 RepID=UPI00058AF65A|nr:trehalose-6-phosphate synthase [Nigerium massiliense]